MFLYGAHVARLSVHVMQVTPSGRPFTVELFHIAGERGLSWIPISITVDDIMLQEPSDPFLIVIRATRGSGPEADIALDQISFTEGICYGDSIPNPYLLLGPLISASASYIRSLKAGPSLTIFLQGSPEASQNSSLSGGKNALSPEQTGRTSLTDPCSLFDSCHSCLSSATADCVWCTATHTCRASLSPDARKCPITHAIHNDAVSVSLLFILFHEYFFFKRVILSRVLFSMSSFIKFLDFSF